MISFICHFMLAWLRHSERSEESPKKAIQIGLLPDLPWEKFQFLGNTALHGALLALLNRDYRQQVTEAASKMTYLELSADNTFYDQFTSALFLPHTDIEKFPSVGVRN